MREFGLAFQELREVCTQFLNLEFFFLTPHAYAHRSCQGLFSHCGEDLLMEGIKLAEFGRGFWLVSFSGIEAVLETWKSGSRMPIQVSPKQSQKKTQTGGAQK